MNDKKKNDEVVRKLVYELQLGGEGGRGLETPSIESAQSRLAMGERAADSLVKIGPSAVPALVKALKSGGWTGGARLAAKALGEIGDPRAVSALIKALKHWDERVCIEAAWALGEFDDPRIVPALIKALNRVFLLRQLFGETFIDYFELNAVAAVTLGKSGDSRAVPALIRALQNKPGHWRVRQNAVSALGVIRDPRAIPALTEVLQDKTLYYRLRHDAAEALEALRDPQAVPTLHKAFQDEGVFCEGLAPKSIAPNAVKARFRDPQVRNPQAVPALIQILGDKTRTGWERRDAIKALGATKGSQAATVLVEVLNAKNTDREMREGAIEALGANKTPQAIQALIEALDDNETPWNVVDALEKIGKPALPALMKATQHPSQDVRYHVAEVLGLIKDLRAVPALAKTLTDEAEGRRVRYNAAEALELIGTPQAVPALIEVLKGQDKYISEVAAKALREILHNYSNLDLRAALPALRRLQKRALVFREVIAQIEGVTDAFKDLPVPAAAPLLDVRSLPRPVAANDMSLDASVPAPPGHWMRLYRTLRGFLAGKVTKKKR